MLTLFVISLLLSLPLAKGKARQVALKESGNARAARPHAPGSLSARPHSLPFLFRHTNGVLKAKCLPLHQSLPRTWLQARLWHLQAHRAKRGTCVPWSAWWRAQAECIHLHEAVNWHETRNPSSRGGMQIQYGTWASVGGRGDPAYASPYEQLYRAFLIWKRDGGSWREWTTAGMCGLA